MNANKVLNWEAFEGKIEELRSKYGTRSSPLLFRGQGNSEWPLTTTLDRSGEGSMMFRDYYRLICARISPAVKTFAGVDVPEYDREVLNTFSDRELLIIPGQFPPIPLYRYMAYLRHHGFPSPLLDWSRSPFVAAYFAFRDPLDGVERRSVYAYCETPTGMKGGAVGEPTVHAIEPYVQTHHRHFRQQCDYTVCGAFDVNASQWRFDSHQNLFNHTRPNQDYLWKFDLPSTERLKVLRLLNDYNLSAFTLFGSEESLLETMWLQEYVFNKRAP